MFGSYVYQHCCTWRVRYLIDMDAQQHVELVRGASQEVVAAAEVNNPSGLLGGEGWEESVSLSKFGKT